MLRTTRLVLYTRYIQQLIKPVHNRPCPLGAGGPPGVPEEPTRGHPQPPASRSIQQHGQVGQQGVQKKPFTDISAYMSDIRRNSAFWTDLHRFLGFIGVH